MPARSKRIELSVCLNGRRVGGLRRNADGSVEFRYLEEWLGWPHSFAISQSLPLREDRYIGDPVIHVLDNLLPDDGNVRRQIAERTLAAGTDPVSLLAAIGRDCVGALQFLPADAAQTMVGSTESTRLSESEVAELLRDLHRSPLGIRSSETFRLSLAGAQEKTALLFRDGEWHLPMGTTPTTHILKPPIGRRSDGLDLSTSVENEHLCMKMVAALGLPAAATRIETFDGCKALVVERFDRTWTEEGRLLRIPQEDFCQALSFPSTRKYEADGGPGLVELLTHLRRSDDSETDRMVLLRAQIVFWLLAATDGHAKNFSMFLLPTGIRLTPFYDVMSVQPLFDMGSIRKNQMKMALSVGNRRHYLVSKILPRHFAETAGQAGVPRVALQRAMEELIDGSEQALEQVGGGLPLQFPEHLLESITNGFRDRIRLLERDARSAS